MRPLVLTLFAIAALVPSARAANPSAAQAAQALNDLVVVLKESANDPARQEVLGAMEDLWLDIQAAKQPGSTVKPSWETFNRLRNDFEQRYRSRFQKVGLEFASIFPEVVEFNFPEIQFVAFKHSSPLHWLIEWGNLVVQPTGHVDSDLKAVDVETFVRRYLPEVAWRVYGVAVNAIEADPIYLKLDIESAAAYDAALASRRPRASRANFDRLEEARETFVGKYLDVFVNLQAGFDYAYSGPAIRYTRVTEDGGLELKDPSGFDLVEPALEWDQAAVAIGPILREDFPKIPRKPYRPFSEIAREIQKKVNWCSAYLKGSAR